MNLLRQFINWFQSSDSKRYAQKYSPIQVSGFPTHVKENVIYIVRDGSLPDTLIFKCPCGCASDIYLNLLKDTRPSWDFRLNKKGKISIVPSVWRKVGCRSHFFVRKSKVYWA